jgi:hypothetical protein
MLGAPAGAGFVCPLKPGASDSARQIKMVIFGRMFL